MPQTEKMASLSEVFGDLLNENTVMGLVDAGKLERLESLKFALTGEERRYMAGMVSFDKVGEIDKILERISNGEKFEEKELGLVVEIIEARNAIAEKIASEANIRQLDGLLKAMNTESEEPPELRYMRFGKIVDAIRETSDVSMWKLVRTEDSRSKVILNMDEHETRPFRQALAGLPAIYSNREVREDAELLVRYIRTREHLES